MAKKYTLDETWHLCLSMWRWIAEQIKARSKRSVKELKREWLDKEGFGPYEIDDNCFFCDYARYYNDNKTCGCVAGKCPGKLVNKQFSCTNKTYNYEYMSIAFYKKLVSLNRKRNKK